jgi:hypothetical protein
MTYILYAIIYLIAGRGVYLLVSVFEKHENLTDAKHFKIFTILIWPVLILYMGTS